MKNSFIKYFILLIILINQIAFSQACKSLPQFIAIKKFDPSRSAISSQENRFQGVVLIQYEDPQNPNSKRTKQYQDPSWLMTGYAGSITTSRNGDVYVLPKANVNSLYNPPENQNTIYKIESQSGLMSAWLNLPMKKVPNQKNGSGLLSAYFDCDNDNLIVSTIAGSSPEEELGMIYCIDILSKNYFSLLENIDVLGLLTSRLNNEKRLFYGLARKSEIWSIALDSKNHIIGKPRLEINIEGLGPRGDDRVRKMRMDQNNILTVYGVPFFYNLTAPVMRQETVYQFQFNNTQKKWILKDLY